MDDKTMYIDIIEIIFLVNVIQYYLHILSSFREFIEVFGNSKMILPT